VTDGRARRESLRKYAKPQAMMQIAVKILIFWHDQTPIEYLRRGANLQSQADLEDLVRLQIVCR